METVKEEALQVISNMPDTSSLDDIMYHLYVMDKVRKGKEAVQRGDIHPIDELRKEMEKW